MPSAIDIIDFVVPSAKDSIALVVPSTTIDFVVPSTTEIIIGCCVLYHRDLGFLFYHRY